MIRESMNLRADVIIDKKEMEKIGFFGRRHATQLTMTETEEVTIEEVKNVSV